MLGVGVVGLIVTTVVVVLGLRLVDRGTAVLDDSLDLTAEAVDTLDATVVVAADATDAAASGLDTITVALRDTATSLDGAETLFAGTADAIGGVVPDSIDSIRQAIPALIQSAEFLQGALEGLSFFGVELPADRLPTAQLREIDENLTDVAVRLRASSGRLDAVAEQMGELGGSATSLSDELARLGSNLQQADALLESYADTTERIAALVAEARSDLDAQRSDGRTLVILLGVIIALGQLVPLSLGWRALRRPPHDLRLDRTHDRAAYESERSGSPAV